jgi:hypothetical protein
MAQSKGQQEQNGNRDAKLFLVNLCIQGLSAFQQKQFKYLLQQHKVN